MVLDEPTPEDVRVEANGYEFVLGRWLARDVCPLVIDAQGAGLSIRSKVMGSSMC